MNVVAHYSSSISSGLSIFTPVLVRGTSSTGSLDSLADGVPFPSLSLDMYIEDY